eukprot:snap_masked-scaffold_33-processed-gene-2.44-mRNA-1 protein AED:1.00 eAED:1.00 QI:0/0/0/0/1/1/2/0/66
MYYLFRTKFTFGSLWYFTCSKDVLNSLGFKFRSYFRNFEHSIASLTSLREGECISMSFVRSSSRIG